MQTRTKQTLTTTALGLALAAAAAGTASATAATGLLPASDSLPVGTELVPGVTSSAAGAQTALTNGTSPLPGDPAKILPKGNHFSGNSVGPVSGLLGGLPAGGVVGN